MLLQLVKVFLQTINLLLQVFFISLTISCNRCLLMIPFNLFLQFPFKSLYLGNKWPLRYCVSDVLKLVLHLLCVNLLRFLFHEIEFQSVLQLINGHLRSFEIHLILQDVKHFLCAAFLNHGLEFLKVTCLFNWRDRLNICNAFLRGTYLIVNFLFEIFKLLGFYKARWSNLKVMFWEELLTHLSHFRGETWS